MLMRKKEEEEPEVCVRVKEGKEGKTCSHEHLSGGGIQGGTYRGQGRAAPLMSMNVWIISHLGLLQMSLL